MLVDLSTTTAENESLSTNVAELNTQLNDLKQQQLQVRGVTLSSGSMKYLANVSDRIRIRVV